LDLAIEAGSATLDQGDVCGKAHTIDVTAGIEVVEGVENDDKLAEPVDIELGVLDVCVMCLDLDVWVELGSGLAGDQSFGLLDVGMAEEELAVEVGQIDCVEIDQVDLAEASADEVLEEFAANATGANDEDARVLDVGELRTERLLEEAFARHGAVRWLSSCGDGEGKGGGRRGGINREGVLAVESSGRQGSVLLIEVKLIHFHFNCRPRINSVWMTRPIL
jgi:hypothetical protein